MAFDTIEKRASVIGYGLPFRIVAPWPSGSIDQGERQHVTGIYAGVLAVAQAASNGTALIARLEYGPTVEGRIEVTCLEAMIEFGATL